jgi:hypothetical protein
MLRLTLRVNRFPAKRISVLVRKPIQTTQVLDLDFYRNFHPRKLCLGVTSFKVVVGHDSRFDVSPLNKHSNYSRHNGSIPVPSHELIQRRARRGRRAQHTHGAQFSPRGRVRQRQLLILKGIRKVVEKVQELVYEKRVVSIETGLYRE